MALPSVEGQGPGVSVLVDFGDGTYLWADVELPSTNVTALKATELANTEWGLSPLNVSWFDSPFCLRSPCAFVNDIDDRDPVYPVWWHFYSWNGSAGTWDSAAYGPSDTDLADGDSIAWYLAVDDPVTYEAPRPAPRVDFRDVHTSFRGDLRNRGQAEGAIPERVRILWDVDVGVAEIDTTPVVADGRVFVATRNRLVAFDSETGTEAWRNPQVHSLLSTPAIYDGRLLLGGTDGRLHSVWASNGAEAWSVPLESGARSTGIASSPAVFEGRAYVGTFNETAGGRGRVVAVDVHDGSVAWSYETGSVHMSQPAIADGALYVGIMGVYDGDIGYDPPYGLLSLHLNGTLRWFHPTDDSVAGSAVVAEGRVVFASKDGSAYALDPEGALLWRHAVGVSTSSPAFAGGRLFVASGGLNGTGGVFAFDLDGNLLWESDSGGAVQASLVSDGRVVCGATNVARGSVFCLRASDGSFLWRLTPSPAQYILGSPVAVGDRVYAPSDNGHLYALSPAATPSVESPIAIILAFLAVTIVVPVATFLFLRRRTGGSHA